ncbi:hypothetical protein EAE96_003007 [Botrytis aclada]|nr:hypothetical protein EAE96_003007 [Botrytis aclada]
MFVTHVGVEESTHKHCFYRIFTMATCKDSGHSKVAIFSGCAGLNPIRQFSTVALPEFQVR